MPCYSIVLHVCMRGNFHARLATEIYLCAKFHDLSLSFFKVMRVKSNKEKKKKMMKNLENYFR